MRTYLSLAAALAVCACAPLEERSEAGAARAEIIGGQLDPNDPEVFLLEMKGTFGAANNCSGTLIAPRTILTASHCVDPMFSGSTSPLIIRVTNKPSRSSALPSDYIDVVETRMHPNWSALNFYAGYDVALMLLKTAPAGVPIKPWNAADVSGFTGKPLRAVGYGKTDEQDDSSFGTKYTVDLTFRAVDQSHITLGDQLAKGVCNGDSGGPSFHTFADGVERVVGVHSHKNGTTCLDGKDVRVDVHAAFINQWLAQKEPAKDCVANGVCAEASCPSPDPDCLAEGKACSSELQCQGRKCVSDPQHPGFYCSLACSASTGCPSGMECGPSGSCWLRQLPVAKVGEACVIGGTWCEAGSSCTGPLGGATTCRYTCALSSECGGGSCEAGQGGLSVCAAPPPPPEVAPGPPPERIPLEEPPRPRSCSAAGGLPLPLAVAVWLALRRRRNEGV